MKGIRKITIGFLLGMWLFGCAGQKPNSMQPRDAAKQNFIGVSADQEKQLETELKQGTDALAASRALFLLGQAHFNRQDWKAAGRLFQQCSKQYPGTGWDRLSQWMMGRVLESIGKPAHAFIQYQKLALPSPMDDLEEKAVAACERIARQDLDEATLDRVIQYPALARFQPLLGFLKLEKVAQRGDVDALASGVEKFLSLYPESQFASQLEKLSQGLFQAVPVDKLKIGVILPGSGSRFEREGMQVMSGFRLALEEINARVPPESAFQFVVADEGSDTITAQASAQKLVEQDKVIAILGPLLSDSALAVAAYASTRRVPVMSSSAGRGGLTEVGSYFFRNCVTPKKLGESMADHALLDMRVTRVASVWPGTWYGRSMVEAFEDRFVSLGGSIPASVSYTPGTDDFKKVMLEIGGVDPGLEKDDNDRRHKEIRTQVETASLKLANFLLSLKPLSPTAQTQGLSQAVIPELSMGEDESGDATVETNSSLQLVFPLRLAIVDFAATTIAAELKSGRALADQFRMVMDQAADIKTIPPDRTAKWMLAHGVDASTIDPLTAVAMSKELNTPLILGGTVREVEPDWAQLESDALKPGKEGRQARAQSAALRRYTVFQVTAHLFDSRTGSITAFQEFEFKKLRSAEINSFGLQAIYAPSSYQEAWGIADALSFFDLHIPMLGGDSWHQPRILKHAEALEGARFNTGFDSADPRPQTQKFVQQYKDRYAEIPQTLAAQAYDAANLVLKVLLTGPEDRESLKGKLLRVRNYKGAAGDYTFKGRNDALRTIPILEIRRGNWQRVR